MPIAALAMAIVGSIALATTIVAGSQLAGWLSIGVCIVGLVLLISNAPQSPRRREAAMKTDFAAFVHHYSDNEGAAHPAADALIHDDHEVERDVIREERVLHSDTGPRHPDFSGEEATEIIQHRSHQGRKLD